MGFKDLFFIAIIIIILGYYYFPEKMTDYKAKMMDTGQEYLNKDIVRDTFNGDKLGKPYNKTYYGCTASLDCQKSYPDEKNVYCDTKTGVCYRA